MNDRDALLESWEELLRVTRELAGALDQARAFVARAADPGTGPVPVAAFVDAMRTLERVDGALADAGELLAAVRS